MKTEVFDGQLKIDLELHQELSRRCPAMLHLLDLDGALMMVSDLWLSTLGYTREEVQGRLITEFLTAESFEYSESEILPSFLDIGHCEDIPYRMKRKDGVLVDVLISAVLGRDKQGQPLYILASLKDVTAQIAAESALLAERKRLSNLIEGTQAATWEWNVQTGKIHFNERWSEIIGMKHSEAASLSLAVWQAQMHADDISRYEKALVDHLKGKSRRFECEFRLRHAEGRWLWIMTHGSVVTRTSDGRGEWLYGMHLDITDRKNQEGKLLQSNDFLEQTGRIAGIGGWQLDLATGKLEWSPETCRIHGLEVGHKATLEEAISFYAPEARPTILAAVEKAANGGGGWDLELPLIAADGRCIWVRAAGTAVFEDGKAIQLRGAFQDIDSKVAERLALESVSERMTLAADAGGIGIWDWNLLTGFQHWDDWTYRLYGMAAQEEPASYELWKRCLHPDDIEPSEKALAITFGGGKPYDVEYRVIWKDGTVHYLRASGQLTRDGTNRAVRMVGANWDITESRTLSLALSEQHELLKVTLQSIGDGVITTDAVGTVVWLNPVAERMTGWTAAEAMGRPIPEIFCILNHETRLPVENPVLKCLARSEVSKLASETILIARDGRRFGIDDSAAPIRGALGELLGAVLVFHDVTEQRRLYTETSRLAKVELKLKDDFLSRVSHELRAPLTSIYSFGSIIADNLAGDTTPEQQEYLQIMLKNVGQLQSMIEDLLTVTQSNEGKLSIEQQEVSIAEPVVDALHTIQGPAERKQIKICSHLPECLPAAFADPKRILQVLIILLDNAVKFTPEGGSISVRVSEGEPQFLLVEVADTGRGIPPEKRSRVFEHLYQITDPHQPDTGQNGRNGLGLGLHIAQDLVRRQGGRIWVSSAEEQGSVFSFTVPVFSERLKQPQHGSPPLYPVTGTAGIQSM